jgi:hypothetical protein
MISHFEYDLSRFFMFIITWSLLVYYQCASLLLVMGGYDILSLDMFV